MSRPLPRLVKDLDPGTRLPAQRRGSTSLLSQAKTTSCTQSWPTSLAVARSTWDFPVRELRNNWLAITSLLNPAETKITWYSPVLDEIGHSPRDG